MADDNLNLRQFLELLLQVVREALRGGSHGVYVHAIGAHAHDAAQASGAELQVFVEGLDEVRRVVLVEQGLHLATGLFVILWAQPDLSFLSHDFQ